MEREVPAKLQEALLHGVSDQAQEQVAQQGHSRGAFQPQPFCDSV